MVVIFKKNNPYNIILLLFYGLLLKLPSFSNPYIPVPESMDGFIYRLLLRWLEHLNLPFVYPLISFVLIFIQALSINRLVINQRLNSKPTYLVGMSYLLITSLIPEWQQLSATLITNTFLIWILSKLCLLHNNQSPKTLIINIGLMIGVASFFYFPALGFIILVIISLIISRPFILPEWLLLFVGVITPYYFFASWVFLTDRINNYQLPAIKVIRHLRLDDSIYYFGFAILFFGILSGIYFVRKNFLRQIVQTRKSWSIIFFLLFISFVIPFVNNGIKLDYWILLTVPASIILSAAFYYPEKKWFPITLHWCFIAIIIAVSYLGIVG